MRILFLSDFYPPVRAGGYAQLCQEVAQGLAARGHHVRILTSNYRHHLAPAEETNVDRRLHLEGGLDYYQPLDFLLRWKRRYVENLATLREVTAREKPDVLLIWNLRGLSKSLAAVAEGWKQPPVAYYLAGYWPVVENLHAAYWEAPARHGYLRIPKRFISSLARRLLNDAQISEPGFKHVMCVSDALKEALIKKGLPIEDAAVIYNGIDPRQFSLKESSEPNLNHGETFKLVYAGRISPQKGVHTAIEAMAARSARAKVRRAAQCTAQPSR